MKKLEEYVKQEFLRKTPKLVDAGCGIGVDVCYLAFKFPSFHFLGYDLSVQNLKKAKERLSKYGNSNCDLVVALHEKIPLRRNSINMIYFHGSLEEEEKLLYAKDFEREIRKERVRVVREVLKEGERWQLL